MMVARQPSTRASTVQGTTYLDQALHRIRRGDVAVAMATLISDLDRLRSTSAPDVWKTFAMDICRAHPVLELLHQEPVTRRVFCKPRGYPGDAEMLDSMYAIEDGDIMPALQAATPLGRQLWTTIAADRRMCYPVLERRQIVCSKIDDLATRSPNLHVLSVACGHLREARRCAALHAGHIARFVGVDQDEQSLAVVEQEQVAKGPVEAVHASVRNILRGQVELGRFDFIYASGLYDYLPTPVALRLTRALFEMLNPDGHLLVGNYLPTSTSAGYMEAIADWWLIHRTRAELLELLQQVPEEEVASVNLFAETTRSIGFIEIARAGK